LAVGSWQLAVGSGQWAVGSFALCIARKDRYRVARLEAVTL